MVEFTKLIDTASEALKDEDLKEKFKSYSLAEEYEQ